ncbi:MAG: sugar phosphate nucleotidyltransferase [Dehalococcoidia bacterium]
MRSVSFVILAAGLGTRMNNNLPKVFTPFFGKEMIMHIVEKVQSLDPREIIIVVPKEHQMFKSLFGEKVKYCIQKEPLGTGHATWQAVKIIDHTNDVFVINGDMPNINEALIRSLYFEHTQKSNTLTITTSFVQNPFGYGRVLRNSEDEIQEIIEESDLDEKNYQINEINAGLYVFNCVWLKKYLLELDHQDLAEYKLTDLVKLAYSNGFQISNVEANEKIIYGVNTLDQLKKLEYLMSDDLETKS